MNDWKEEKLKDLVEVDPEQLSSITDPDYSFFYIDISSVSLGNVSFPNHSLKYKEAPSRARKILKDNDILMSTVRPNLKAFAQFRKRSKSNFIASTGFAVLRSRPNVEVGFIYHSLFSNDVEKQIEALVVGSNYPAINSSDIRNLKINIPSFPIQQKIAHILTTCDTVIEQTQSAIAKYKAIKQGLLHDLFTRGLAANGHLRPGYQDAPELYKESELGMIPKEWEVKRLGDYLINLEAGVSVNSTDNSSMDYIAVLKTSAVSCGYFYPSENKVVVLKDIERVKINPKADSIIISRMNTPALVGECGYIDKDYPLLFLPDRLWQTIFRDKQSICVLWLNFLLNTETYKKIIKDSATGTSDSMKNITKSAFFELKIPFCSINEQSEIAKRISSLDNKIQSEEILLQKYQSIKQGLMWNLLGGGKRCVCRDAMHGVSTNAPTTHPQPQTQKNKLP